MALSHHHVGKFGSYPARTGLHLTLNSARGASLRRSVRWSSDAGERAASASVVPAPGNDRQRRIGDVFLLGTAGNFQLCIQVWTLSLSRYQR